MMDRDGDDTGHTLAHNALWRELATCWPGIQSPLTALGRTRGRLIGRKTDFDEWSHHATKRRQRPG